MRFDFVICDLDGTLVDSLPDIAAALNRALGEAGHATVDPEVVRYLVGGGVRKLVERAIAHASGRTDADLDALKCAIVAHYRRHPCVDARPFPEILQTLARLKDGTGRRLAVLSNKPGDIARSLLAALALDAPFDAVLGDGDGYPTKPDPGAARALLQRFGASPERTLVVGDGIADVALARAVGCRAAAVAWGYTERARLEAERPDWLLETPAELLTIT